MQNCSTGGACWGGEGAPAIAAHNASVALPLALFTSAVVVLIGYLTNPRRLQARQRAAAGVAELSNVNNVL